MGQFQSSDMPDKYKDPTFDPMLGFENGRKKREMKVTLEEMESAKMPLEERGYCAHHFIIYNTCRRDVWPMAYKCKKEKHAYETCKQEDYVIRMKEYEREKRLMARAVRLEKKRRRDEAFATS